MPKMSNDQGERITQCVVEFLQADKLNTFNFNQICEYVQKKLGLGNPSRIAVVLNALIGSKTIHGKSGTWARYKDPNEAKGFGDKEMAEEEYYTPPKGLGDAKESAWKKEVDDLRRVLEVTRKDLRKQEELTGELEKKVKSGYEQYKEIETRLKAAQSETRIVAVQVKHGDKVERTIEGLYHREFERILKLAQARMNIFAYGPTGCGKTHVARQVADALDLRFGFISCTSGMGEATLGGRMLPIGKGGTFEYIPSEFVDFYENGGVYLLDELDAADPNVMLLINAALANGWITVSNRHKNIRAEIHPDFVCIAAGNTIGTGADRMYSARNKLDASTMDRFSIGKVYMDYDHRLEEQICPDQDLLLTLWGYREKIQENRMERAMSTRFIRDAYRMKSEFGYTMEDIDRAFFMSFREDEINKIKAGKLHFAKDAKVILSNKNDKHSHSRENSDWNAQRMAEFKAEMARAKEAKTKAQSGK